MYEIFVYPNTMYGFIVSVFAQLQITRGCLEVE